MMTSTKKIRGYTYNTLSMLWIRSMSILNPRRKQWWSIQRTVSTIRNSIQIKGNILLFRYFGPGGRPFRVLGTESNEHYQEEIQFEAKGTYSSFDASRSVVDEKNILFLRKI